MSELPTLERRHHKQVRTAAVTQWWHSIDLGDGVVTAGHKSRDLLAVELRALELPPLAGKSVLDIGAWDGYFSFAAERQGAARVVALDYYSWRLDPEALDRVAPGAFGEGRAPATWTALPELFDSDLPGKRGFDIAHELLGSGVAPVVADFTTMDLESLGVFDVVLFLGVLYHLRHPLAALERVRQVTADVAVIESHANYYPGMEHRALCSFLEHDELNDDHENWWVPNLAGLQALCRAAGFRATRVCSGPPRSFAGAVPGSGPMGYRATLHAYA